MKIKYSKLISDLRHLDKIRLRRALLRRDSKPLNVQMHSFSDASERAYSGTIYLRTQYENHEIDVNLIASKSKVAPLGHRSIPRLELSGAYLCARLAHSIHTTLNFPMEMWLWTDSTTVAWIRNHKLWKKFVMERVDKIRELTPMDPWNHCPGVMNPVYLATAD